MVSGWNWKEVGEPREQDKASLSGERNQWEIKSIGCEAGLLPLPQHRAGWTAKGQGQGLRPNAPEP
jgi:hypothetical protein